MLLEINLIPVIQGILTMMTWSGLVEEVEGEFQQSSPMALSPNEM